MHQTGGLVGAEQIEIVSDAARLADVGPAWNDLWSQTGGLIFQSHAWISGWWNTAPDRDQRQLRVGLLWDAGRLVAVMPLCVTRRRRLRFLEWAANSHSDYEDILAAPDCPPAALARLWAQLTQLGGFDIALLNRLRPDARAHGLLTSSIGAPLRPNHRSEVAYRVVSTLGSGAAWFNGQSKKTRKHYRHGHNTIAEAGTTQFRLLGADEPLEPVLARVAVLKREWLIARGHTSNLFDDGDQTLAALVNALAHAGILRIFVLEVDGVIAAISINFEQHGVMMAFITTFDPRFERASPGSLLMTDYITWSFDNGLHTVDFLCGAEAFKSRFATDHIVLTTMVAPGSLLGRTVLLLDSARHRFVQWRAARAAQKSSETSDQRVASSVDE
ncbi:MAG: GNAT family N-acetyltransferase [Alphaproteobacteria bacterium]|nr:GNAT family N-acetyltransferase [Alphaproteobacteria bacterium]